MVDMSDATDVPVFPFHVRRVSSWIQRATISFSEGVCGFPRHSAPFSSSHSSHYSHASHQHRRSVPSPLLQAGSGLADSHFSSQPPPLPSSPQARPTFYPPLGHTSEVKVPVSDRTSYARLTFFPTFTSHEDTCGTWELWTDIPCVNSGGEISGLEGTWRAVSFRSLPTGAPAAEGIKTKDEGNPIHIHMPATQDLSSDLRSTTCTPRLRFLPIQTRPTPIPSVMSSPLAIYDSSVPVGLMASSQ